MVTYIIIAVTTIISVAAFSSGSLMSRLQFNPALVVHKKEYFRLLSHAFVHVNWVHLFVNMTVLFFFGRAVEMFFRYYFPGKESVYFVLLYVGGALFSNLWSLMRYRNNFYYNAVGASGAVSAVLFAFVFFEPWEPVYLFGIVPVPGIIFAAIYLVYSYLMSRKKNDNIAHDAHFLGSVFGFLFPVLLNPALFQRFVDKLLRLI